MSNRFMMSIAKGLGAVAVIIGAILFMAFIGSFDYASVLTSEINTNEVELLVSEYTNKERNAMGLPDLINDQRLSDIAREHSTDMAQNGFYDHTNLDGLDPTDRANQALYNCKKEFGTYFTDGIAENIIKSPENRWYTSDEIATQLVESWMNSSGHRENILHTDYDRIGVGISISDDGWVFGTQNFC